MTRPAEENQVGSELRLLRDLTGIGGRAMARRIGISRSKLSRIEIGTHLPTTDEVTVWTKAADAPEKIERFLSMLSQAVRIKAESKHRPRTHSIAELLDTGARQLRDRDERIHQSRVTVDNLALVADYMRELAEHGMDVAHLADRAIDDAPRRHPVLSTHEGGTSKFACFTAESTIIDEADVDAFLRQVRSVELASGRLVAWWIPARLVTGEGVCAGLTSRLGWWGRDAAQNRHRRQPPCRRCLAAEGTALVRPAVTCHAVGSPSRGVRSPGSAARQATRALPGDPLIARGPGLSARAPEGSVGVWTTRRPRCAATPEDPARTSQRTRANQNWNA